MSECPYLSKNGKKCNKKLKKDEIICQKHNHVKNQSGGFIYELIYPAGASVSAATFALYKLNNLVNQWYWNKRDNKKSKDYSN